MSTTPGHPRRWAILGIMCLALVIASLDMLVITMAVPSIRTQLGATPGELQWTVDAYALAFAAPILFAGALADRFGRRRGFLTGLVVFLIASAAAAFAGSPETLIAARAGMGLGAAMIMPCTLAILGQVFPPQERAKAMGIWVGVASLGVPLGPIVGGLLLQNFWWGSVFLINLPIVAVAIVGCLVLIPESRNENHAGLDVLGLVLTVAGSLALVDGIIEAPAHGWTSPRTLSFIVGGAAILAIFIWWERRTRTPMLSHAVFRDRRFGGPLVTISTVFFGVFGSLFVITQYLQFTLGYRPLIAGLHMLGMCTVMLVAPQAPRLVQRFGLGPVSALGPLLVAVSMAVMAFGGPPSSLRVLIALGLLGLGIGFGAPTSVDSVVGAAPPEQSGAGSAVADVAMNMGGSLGIAIMGSAAATASTGVLTDLTPPMIAGVCVAGAGALVVATILPRGRATAAAPPAERVTVPATDPVES
ncbi:MFS transporter [Amycolatopsis sp. NPDC024027]|uniref:MFS transporter n=1 Tax=Amycolatopsis sp. NPDC024027 TaxID=3154327 RepID=UPI0033F7270C